MTDMAIIILSCFISFMVGLCLCIRLVYPITLEIAKRIYSKVYDDALNEALKRLHGNKKTH